MTEPNLRLPAVFCENLRFSAVSCALQMLEFPGEGVNLRKICGFLRKSAFWALSVTLVPSPSVRPDAGVQKVLVLKIPRTCCPEDHWFSYPFGSPLSDPRNRNHKSLAIGNHNFEVANFSRRNRSKIAVSQSQNRIYVALLKHYKTTKLAVPESKDLASEGVFGVAVIFLSCDCSR